MEIDIDKLKNEVAGIAEDTFSEYGHEVAEEARKFIEQTKDKLIDWIKLFANSQLSRGEFIWLINSQIDLMKLEGLKEAGIAAVKFDVFKMKLLNAVIDVAAKIIL